MELCQSSARPKGLISKTLQRCLSQKMRSVRYAASPAGWVSVRVGKEKEKFLIQAEWMNHKLFQRLLDDAEEKYGYAVKGSLELPCSIEVFNLVLWEMDQEEADCDAAGWSPLRKIKRGYRLLSPSSVAAAGRL